MSSIEKIAFIGAGNMATSLIGGLLRAGTPARDIVAADPVAEQRAKITELGVRAATDNGEAVRDANIVVLAVKPQVMKSVVVGLANSMPKGALVISIAAGITTASIAAWCGASRSIVRCMPNTPALYGAGITALYANEHTVAQQRRAAQLVLGAAGAVIWVEDEADLDAVTAVSGSGPAYFFLLMEAMTSAAMQLGLDHAVAAELTLATAHGAAVMARETRIDPAQLRRNVTSPGGTTEAALTALQAARVREAFVEAIVRAAARSRELAKQFE